MIIAFQRLQLPIIYIVATIRTLIEAVKQASTLCSLLECQRSLQLTKHARRVSEGKTTAKTEAYATLLLICKKNLFTARLNVKARYFLARRIG